MNHLIRTCTAVCVALASYSASGGGVSIDAKLLTLKDTEGGLFTINAETAIVYSKAS